MELVWVKGNWPVDGKKGQSPRPKNVQKKFKKLLTGALLLAIFGAHTVNT